MSKQQQEAHKPHSKFSQLAFRATGQTSGHRTKYAYDAAWNLNYRTNNALVQSFGVDSLNQLTTLTRSGTMTVAGSVSTEPTSVTVKDNNNAAQAATVYGDSTFARANVTLLNGTNTFEAVAQDSYGRVDTNKVTASLPASATCYYDGRGNLTNDGRRVFFYDAENQLVTVLVSNAWKSDFVYDGFMRRRIRFESAWGGADWVTNQVVRYIYDGRLVVQERHYTLNATTLIPRTIVSYTRGRDIGGRFQTAGGIGGLLARSEISNLQFPHAYYHADGNGNITAMVATNGLVVARYQYEPFGNVIGKSGPLADGNVYGFSSKERDSASGLYYYGLRFYAPDMQRWLNPDPLGEAGGINLYGFVGNSPVNYVDAYGLLWEDWFAELLQGLYDMAMGDRSGGVNKDTYGYLRGQELGGIDADNNVLRDSFGEGGRIVGGNATDYLAGEAGGMVLGAACRLAGKGLRKAAAEGGELLGKGEQLNAANFPGAKQAFQMTKWGWEGSKAWRDAANLLGKGGTIEGIAGKIPSRNEALKLLEQAGATVERIEGAHLPPNPHTYPHINFTTGSGAKGTIRVEGI